MANPPNRYITTYSSIQVPWVLACMCISEVKLGFNLSSADMVSQSCLEEEQSLLTYQKANSP
jgi:hypothetical protein